MYKRYGQCLYFMTSALPPPGHSQELAEAAAMMHNLRDENRTLRGNFDELKAIHLQLLAAHKALQAQAAGLQEERAAVEKQYQAICDSWRVELEDKQKEFDDARAQMLQPR